MLAQPRREVVGLRFMTIDEQDNSILRLVRERREVKRNLAALEMRAIPQESDRGSYDSRHLGCVVQSWTFIRSAAFRHGMRRNVVVHPEFNRCIGFPRSDRNTPGQSIHLGEAQLPSRLQFRRIPPLQGLRGGPRHGCTQIRYVKVPGWPL